MCLPSLVHPGDLAEESEEVTSAFHEPLLNQAVSLKWVPTWNSCFASLGQTVDGDLEEAEEEKYHV